MILPRRPVSARSFDLKPPDMVAEFDPTDELLLGEFGEVAVDGGPVKSEIGKRLRHLGVGAGASHRAEMIHHRQPGSRTSQPAVADAGLHGLESGSF